MDQRIFKAYDIRGVYPLEINEDAVERVAKAYAEFLKPQKVAVGRDVRTSSPALFDAVVKGFTEMGVNVVDIGIVSTDMLYFAISNYGFDGGITVTASHNSAQFNGLKLEKSDSKPLASDSGLSTIKELAQKNEFKPAERKGKVEKLDVSDDYIQKILSFVDTELIREMKFQVVVNPNFGTAGQVLLKLAAILDLHLEKLNFEQDGTFPKGRPDPMIPELRMETSRFVKDTGADLGASWDADADRFFMYDENGRFVDAYYTGTLLSKSILSKHKGEKVIHDPRLVWAVEDAVKEMRGVPLTRRAGHAFLKEYMREENAIFGMESAGHFYFHDYYYCDNGMIPFLLVLEEMAKSKKKLSELIDPIRFAYPVSEEVNFKVNDVNEVLKNIEEKNKSGKIDHTDGISVEYPDWRFNLRASNTESLVRLNVEAKTREILDPMKAAIIQDIKEEITEA